MRSEVDRVSIIVSMRLSRFAFLLLIVLQLDGCGAMRMCNVCSAKSCNDRGAKIFAAALTEVMDSSVVYNAQGCLRQCGKGVVIKAFGDNMEPAPKGLLAWYPVVDTEAEAVKHAAALLADMGGLDEAKLEAVEAKLAAGDRALPVDPPVFEETCEHCGAGLAKYRGKCAACGDSGERVFFGKFGG